MVTNVDNDSGDHNILEYGMYSEATLLESDHIVEGEQIKFEHVLSAKQAFVGV